MSGLERATDHSSEQAFHRAAWTVTEEQMVLAEAMAGGSGRITDVLLMEELGRMLVNECPGRATAVLLLEAVVTGEVQAGLPLSTEMTLLPGTAARGQADFKIEVSAADRTIMLAMVSVLLPVVPATHAQ